jgi:adenine-specific DNA-methyltransferase
VTETDEDKSKDKLISDLRQQLRTARQAQNSLGLSYKHIPEAGEDAAHLAAGDIPVLTRVPDLSTDKHNDETDHMIVEGDNLIALHTLLPRYAGKVNVIYIDPPYNTGNQDFVYNDKYVDPDDGFRHSKWLSFMEPRLKIAREMLADDGIIFVSIDDHEHAYLKILMDKIFGSRNFLANFIWHKTDHVFKSKKNVYSKHEYILCYVKDITSRNDEVFLSGKTQTTFQPAPLYNALMGEPQRIVFPKDSLIVKLKDGIYNKATNNHYQLMKPFIVKNHQAVTDLDIKFTSRWGQKTVDKNVKRGDKFIIRKDTFSLTVMYSSDKDSFTSSLDSILPGTVGTTSRGTNLLTGIMDEHQFSYPKPMELIKYLIKATRNKNGIVLDFFAGSGTTGHAVAMLNAEDGGHRKAILVTNNFETRNDGSRRETGIARGVTAPRMRAVLTGRWADGKPHDPLPGNLVYYRVDWLPRPSGGNLTETVPIKTWIGQIAVDEDTLRVLPVDGEDTGGTDLSDLVRKGKAIVLTNEDRSKHVLVVLDPDLSVIDPDSLTAAGSVFSKLNGADTVYSPSDLNADVYLRTGCFPDNVDEKPFPTAFVSRIRSRVKTLENNGTIVHDGKTSATSEPIEDSLEDNKGNQQ